MLSVYSFLVLQQNNSQPTLYIRHKDPVFGSPVLLKLFELRVISRQFYPLVLYVYSIRSFRYVVIEMPGSFHRSI